MLKHYQILPGAAETLAELKARAVPFVLLTNGSAYPPATQAARLREAGLAVADGQMITPSSIAADHMSRAGIRRVLVLGTPGVAQALIEAGIEVTYTGGERATEVDAVYVGWHPDCGMQDIEAACQAIWAGARLYTASDVPFFATRQGKTIGFTYAIVGAIRRLTKAPAILTGKPSLHALRFVARRLDLPVRDIGIVGDDPAVETLMARRGGATAFAVTTGTTSLAEWRRQPKLRQPHQVLSSLSEILRWVAADAAEERRTQSR
ncbi:MAG: HAD hydrolase-like protein [Sinobacteraceae bacterium]|nr:HAD hydrolase-like protein [Nevskiaceae bacterium]